MAIRVNPVAFEQLAAVARALSGDTAYAFIGIEPTSCLFHAPSLGTELVSGLTVGLEVFVLDAFPYQVLPEPLARRLGDVPGLRSLAGGRYELGIGEPESWLFDGSGLDPDRAAVWARRAESRRDPGVQQRAHDLLSPVLLQDVAFR